MAIEASKTAIDLLPVNVEMLQSLREPAKLAATHYSTGIEGNRLSQEEVREVLVYNAKIANRERDETEVRNYYRALDFVEELSGYPTIRETDIQQLHGLAYEGKSMPTGYRDGQNVIRESKSGHIVYMPPEAKDVPALMLELVEWISVETRDQRMPIPIIAAIAHYQFATIHPYFDGNGRTARLLATLILHQNGYGLKGIYSLDKYYADHLQSYYSALTVGHHNYYFGRVDADITGFMEYFCVGMAEAVASVQTQAQQAKPFDHHATLRLLSATQKLALELFRVQAEVKSIDLAEHLQINARAARDLAKNWADQGFLEVANASNRARSYQLGGRYRGLLKEG